MVRQNGSDPLLLKVELDKTSFVTGNRAYEFPLPLCQIYDKK